MLTHLLVDFDNLIIAVETNVKSRIHDANAAQNNFHFQQILQNKFALGDSGYAGVYKSKFRSKFKKDPFW
jgi:hypothetical protein